MRILFQKPDIAKLSKEYMLVDMHFHSRYSHDSSTPIQAIIDRAKQLGVHVALTDHNTIQGVLAAEQIAPGVIKPGIEITTKEGKDVLVYFFSVQDLVSFYEGYVRPYVRNTSSIQSGKTHLSVRELFRALTQYECVVTIPHPLAVGPRNSYKFFQSGKGAFAMPQVDAIEGINEAVLHRRNLAAIGWSFEKNKACVAGSDGHILAMLGTAFTVAKADSWEEFLQRIRQKQVFVVGEQRKLRHHMMNMARILREKAKILENKKIRNEKVHS